VFEAEVVVLEGVGALVIRIELIGIIILSWINICHIYFFELFCLVGVFRVGITGELLVNEV